MGLLSASMSSELPPTPKPSPDGAYEAPNRNARAHCWQARDTFFECLERNAIVDSIKYAGQAQKLCGEEGKGFERDCASSWVRTTFIVMLGRRLKNHRSWNDGHFLVKSCMILLNASS